MDLQFYGKNVEITDTIKKYTMEKTGKLARFLPVIDESKIEISKEGTRSPQNRFSVQITIGARGTLLRSEEKAPSINLAIDAAVNSLTRQISRFKGKFSKKGKTSVSANKNTASSTVTVTGRKKPAHVVRTKRFVVKSMTVDEAAEQMEMLSHDFFLFLNEDDGAMNLIYRRRDGNYGVIVPEVGKE